MRELRDYCYQLLEYLRYALQNLDPTNFNEQEMDAWITKPIMAQITDVNGNIAQLALTADSLTSQLQNAEGDINTLQQTARSLTSRISSAEGNLTTLTQTATSLTTRVESAEGSIATVQQTASGLSSTVTDLSGKYTSLKQTVDGFDFTGVVRFSDLTDKSTSISGNCIDTGWVSLDHLDISNDYGYIDIQRGSTGSLGDAGESTRGVVLAGPTVGRLNGEKISNSFFVSDAGVRITAWDDDYNNNNFWVSGTRTHMDVDYDTTSDRRKKNSIAHDVAERYGALYRALRPARFKFNNGTSDRFHTGFIAQEVEQAIADSGLDTKDLAALVKDEDGMYAIRYAELIALNTAMIQKLMTENDNLKAEIAALKEKIDAT